MRVHKIYSTLVLLIAIGALGASGIARAIDDWPTEFALLTPKDATDIERRSYIEDGKMILNFSVKRLYPKFALDSEQYAKLQKSGWTECNAKQDKWSHFFDASSNAIPDKRCRYTFSKHFLRGTHLLFVMQERHSKHEVPDRCPAVPAVPDNNDIDVNVLYRIYDTQQQLKHALQIMNISCAGQEQEQKGVP